MADQVSHGSSGLVLADIQVHRYKRQQQSKEDEEDQVPPGDVAGNAGHRAYISAVSGSIALFG